MIVGTEWLVDASGCRAETLREVEALRGLFDRIISELNLRVVGEQMWHSFPSPGGVTGLALLTESHLACHTYPEFQTATINLYCCRERPAWPWAERLAEMLGAEKVGVRVHHRVVDETHAIEPESAIEPEIAIEPEPASAPESSSEPELLAPSLTGGGR
jgi:S-adenosylmethionine decarboxylase